MGKGSMNTYPQVFHDDARAHNELQVYQKHIEHHNHTVMIADFRRRFRVSLIFSLPILILSPLIQIR